MKTKISELRIPHLNTQALAESVRRVVESEEIADFLRILNEDPQKIRKIVGIGRKTLPSLLEAIEREGYDVPKIIMF